MNESAQQVAFADKVLLNKALMIGWTHGDFADLGELCCVVFVWFCFDLLVFLFFWCSCFRLRKSVLRCF